MLYNVFVILNVKTVQNNAVLILNYLYKQKFLEFFLVCVADFFIKQEKICVRNLI